eukprot:TRINITY_DN13817_c0_g1_i2.p1 TRINITY_DN13817_c0_g1~~TRINITY_DN13817_c0_g1_i2.p1  ORF type:complete len:924 (+),score=331.28 TRINITY_DN13817_c0_g1_i2:85-2772(+)
MADSAAPASGRSSGRAAKTGKEKRPAKGKDPASAGNASELPRTGPRGTSPVKEPAGIPQPRSVGVTVVAAGESRAEPGALLELFCKGVAPEGKKKKSREQREQAPDDGFEPRTVGAAVPDSERSAPGDPASLALSLLVCQSPDDHGALMGADCVLLCFAPANPPSLEVVRNKWVPAIRQAAERARRQPAVLLCGTRLEYLQKKSIERLVKQAKEQGTTYREVSELEAARAAEILALNGYLEVSAKNNKGVKHAVLRAGILGARARKTGPSGGPLQPYVLTADIERELREARAYVLLPPYKPRWVQHESKGKVWYYDTKTKTTRKDKPPDFDGEDKVGKREEEERRRQEKIDADYAELRADRSKTEARLAREHTERCTELQLSVLALQEEVCLFESRVAILYRQQAAAAEEKSQLQKQLTALEEERAEEERRGEEQAIAARERVADLERRELEHSDRAQRLASQQFDEAQLAQLARQLSELRQRLGEERRAREGSEQELRTRRAREKAAVDATGHTEGMVAVGRARIDAERKHKAQALEALAGLQQLRRRLNAEVSRASAEEVEQRIAAEHRAAAQKRLRRDIETLDVDILHAQCAARPVPKAKAAALRSELPLLLAERRRLCEETATAAAVAVTAADGAAAARAAVISAAKEEAEAYNVNLAQLRRGCDLLAATCAVWDHRAMRCAAAARRSRVRSRRRAARESDCTSTTSGRSLGWRAAEDSEQAAAERSAAAADEVVFAQRLLATRAADCAASGTAVQQAVHRCDELLARLRGEPTAGSAAAFSLQCPDVSGGPVDYAAGRHTDGCAEVTRRRIAAAERAALAALRRLLPQPPAVRSPPSASPRRRRQRPTQLYAVAAVTCEQLGAALRRSRRAAGAAAAPAAEGRSPGPRGA